jgi:hypothetical protein
VVEKFEKHEVCWEKKFKVKAKEDVISDEINGIKKKPGMFHQDNRKVALRPSQKSARLTHHSLESVKV